YPASLISYWPFDSGPNDTVSGNNAITNAAVFNATSGEVGGAYYTGGSTNMYTTNAVIVPATGFTFMYWAKIADTSPTQRILEEYWDAGGTVTTHVSGGALYGLVRTSGGYQSSALSYPVSGGMWNFIAITADSGNYSLYINGALVSQVASSGILATNKTLFFGSGNPSAYFAGYMDEVAFFNRSINASEVSQFYNNSRGGLGDYFNASTLDMISNFTGLTTNLSNLSNPYNVTGLVLDKPGRGTIRFPASHGVNAFSQDYDSYVLLGSGFIAVNASALDSSFNSSATLDLNLTGIYSGFSAPPIYYSHQFANSSSAIIQSGALCSAPRCTGIYWNYSTGILEFNVSGFSGYAIYNGSGSQAAGTLGLNITSTNQIAVYTASAKNNSAFSFIPVAPPAASSITLTSNKSSNVINGDTGFLVENQGNVNVSITVASDKNASVFIGGSTPLFQMFGGVNESGACGGTGLNTSMQDLGASAITVCPSLAYPDTADTIWAYVLVRINSDSPPQTNTATLTFTSTQN
ncbi:MAG TPA: LamG domain-containing protein, partial [Candidatus Micrarchaeota archaeon]|nr:LamG domain-containing protein [Candidatus Micrarchaeota archaeon]